MNKYRRRGKDKDTIVFSYISHDIATNNPGLIVVALLSEEKKHKYPYHSLQ
jgi:hypothetical protein